MEQVEPMPGSTGLLTPALRQLWPQLMNSAFARASEGQPLLEPAFGKARKDQVRCHPRVPIRCQ